MRLQRANDARLSGLPLAHLERAIAAKELKAIKTGAGWRIKVEDLEGYVRRL